MSTSYHERKFLCTFCKKQVTLPADSISVRIIKNPNFQKGIPTLSGHHECPKKKNERVTTTKVIKFIKHDPSYVKEMIKKYGKY